MLGVSVKSVVKIIDEVFRLNYTFAPPGFDGEGGDSLREVIYQLTRADEDAVVQAVIDQLIDDDPYWPPDGGEPFYQQDAGYEESDYALETHSRLWGDFLKSILYGQRFFNEVAKGLLKGIFDGVHLQLDVNHQSPVYMIEPGSGQSSFYRARVSDSDSVQKEISENIAQSLGPPPARYRRAGRMNPAGITAFYGAFDLDTCIAELRPTVGGLVTGARFEITEPLCVLDMTHFKAPPTPLDAFDRDYNNRSAQWQFMRRFMDEIGQPVSPTDEHLDYIPTQAVAEYLLNHHQFTFKGTSGKIEAVIYRSAQNPEGKNIAILGEAAKVGVLDADKPKIKKPDAELLASTEWWLYGKADKFRIAVKPNSLETKRVTGASYVSISFGTYYPDEPVDF